MVQASAQASAARAWVASVDDATLPGLSGRPCSVQMPSSKRAWGSSLSAPKAMPPSTLHFRTLSQPQPVTLSDLAPDATLADVRALLARALGCSLRRHMTIRHQGVELADGSTLQQHRVSEGATLQLSMRPKSGTELESLAELTHVLLISSTKDAESPHLAVPVGADTLVGAVKKEMRAPEAEVYFSPHHASSFGHPLLDERTLGSYGVLDGDVLYFASAAAAAGSAPPPKGKPPSPPKKK